MKVLAMVVAVLVSSTVEYGEANASKEICELIRSNELDILTMGARGKSFDDAHFYLLAKGGYMFKVPLANLRVHAENSFHQTTSLTIDRDFIRADELFNVSRDLFTRKYRFFLISNQNQDTAFLGRMFFNTTNESEYQLYNLNGGQSKRHRPRNIDVSVHVMASVGIDSTTVDGGEFGSHIRLFRHNTYEAHNKDKLKITIETPYKDCIMEFPSTTDLVTAFYLVKPNKNDGYYYFLDVNGLVTVSRRSGARDFPPTLQALKVLYMDRFELNLSSFVVCNFTQTTTDPQTIDPQKGDWTYWTIVALCLGTTVLLGGIAIYCYCDTKKEKAKRKDHKKKDRRSKTSKLSSNLSFVSSNASSMASKASTFLQSVKSGITSLLSRNKFKQAKTVVKAKNAKAKAKKPKSPKL